MRTLNALPLPPPSIIMLLSLKFSFPLFLKHSIIHTVFFSVNHKSYQLTYFVNFRVQYRFLGPIPFISSPTPSFFLLRDSLSQFIESGAVSLFFFRFVFILLSLWGGYKSQLLYLHPFWPFFDADETFAVLIEKWFLCR